MKIRKTFVGNLPDNKIVNSNSTSETDTYSCKYLNERNVIVSSEEPTTGEEVWVQEGQKNIFDGIMEQGTTTIDGINTDATTRIRSKNYTKVTPGADYKIHIKGTTFQKLRISISGFTKNDYTTPRNYFSGWRTLRDNYSIITIPDDVQYIRFVFESYDATITVDDVIGVQIDEYIAKIHMKNENGEYEEFYNGEPKSKVLWTNSYPQNTFPDQNIILSSDDYDMLEFAFSPNLSNTETYWFKIRKGDNFSAKIITGDYPLVIRHRICTWISDTEYNIQDSKTFTALNSSTYTIDNTRVIPICVIGHKTGLF